MPGWTKAKDDGLAVRTEIGHPPELAGDCAYGPDVLEERNNGEIWIKPLGEKLQHRGPKRVAQVR